MNGKMAVEPDLVAMNINQQRIFNIYQFAKVWALISHFSLKMLIERN